jgi:hypothetical protein
VSVFTAQRSTPQEERLMTFGESDDGALFAQADTVTPSPITVSANRSGRNRLTFYVTRNEVRSEPTEPQDTMIGQRPGVVRVPTFHVHEMRPPRFG